MLVQIVQWGLCGDEIYISTMILYYNGNCDRYLSHSYLNPAVHRSKRFTYPRALHQIVFARSEFFGSKQNSHPAYITDSHPHTICGIKSLSRSLYYINLRAEKHRKITLLPSDIGTAHSMEACDYR